MEAIRELYARKRLGAVVGLASFPFLVSAMAAGFTALRGGSVAEVTISTAVACGLTILGLLMAFFPRIDVVVKYGFGAYFMFCMWLLGLFGPLAGAMWTSRWILSEPPLWLQMTLVVAWGVLLAGIICSVVLPALRLRVFEVLSGFGVIAPIWYAINVLVIATVFFATDGALLAHAGMLTILPPPEKAALVSDSTLLHGMLLDFFMWHFLAELPLHINETLQWDEPLRYQGVGMGSMLILFKIAVIGPVVAIFVLWWKQRTEPAPASAKSAIMDGETT